MSEFRIPVMSREAVVRFPDGVQVTGIVFIPTAAPIHDGAMRVVEWLNSEERFFPLNIHGEEGSVLINKQNVLCLTTCHESSDIDIVIDAASKREVRIETLHGAFMGQLVVDMPSHKHRASDVLNDEKQFIYLLDSGKEVHINKRFITKAVEDEG